MRIGIIVAAGSIVAGMLGTSVGCKRVDEEPRTTAAGVGGRANGGGGNAGGGGGRTDGVGGTGGTPADPCPGIAPALTAITEDAFPDDQPGGVIVGVATPACAGWAYGAGGLEPVPSDGLVKYALASRLLVAAAIMSLVDEGELTLTDTLDRWRPAVPNADAITVQMLLNHTAGLANHFANPTLQSALVADPDQTWTPDELIDFTAELPADPPGVVFDTQFINFILLGVIIEETTGRPAHEAIRTRVIEPLGLSSVVLLGSESSDTELVPGYLENGQEATDFLHPSAWGVSASYAGTVSDLTRLLRGLFGTEVVVSAASRAAMVEMTVATGEPGFRSGLGLFVDTTRVRDMVGQSGTIPGYEVRAYYVPELDAGMVVLATNDGAFTLAPLYAVFDVLNQPR
ncbi:MAG: serine hydrolase domain-containing protein [Myxococcota bacterium]